MLASGQRLTAGFRNYVEGKGGDKRALIDSAHCDHPPRRQFTWFSRDIEVIHWLVCCRCGKVWSRKVK